MSSSTALLPKNKKDEHPIFLRACHSPWVSVNQKILVLLRWIFGTYMFATFTLILYYELDRQDKGPAIFFHFANISYLLQLIYIWLTLTWTYMHLNYPHHASAPSSHARRFQALLSPPRQDPTTKNRVFFSIFYTAVVVFPHVVTLVYWLIIVPKIRALGVPDVPIDIPGGCPDGNVTVPKPPADSPVSGTPPVDGPPGRPDLHDLFGGHAFQKFFIVNLYGVNSIIALVEVLIFSSIKRQTPIWAHVVGLTILSLVYVAWQYFGQAVTGAFAYYFFDPDQIGWEFVIIAIVAFAGLANTFFAVVYGLTGFREILTASGEERNSGYTRLPQ